MVASSRKWKSLLHRVEYLRLEVEERRDQMREWESELTREIAEIDPPEVVVGESGVEPGTSVGSLDPDSPGGEPEGSRDESQEGGAGRVDEEVPPEADTRPESARKLWKSIAAKTHPDRTGGDEELVVLYKRAARAWESGDLDVLLGIALELRLPVPDPDPEMIRVLEEKADSLNRELQGIEGTVLWAWGNANREKRKAIAGVVAQNRKARRAAEAQARRKS